MDSAVFPLSCCTSQHQQHQPAAALPPLPPKAGPSSSSGGSRRQQQQQHGDTALVDPQSSFRVTPSGQHYYELDDPAAALAALEHDMAALMTEIDAQEDVAPGGPPPQVMEGSLLLLYLFMYLFTSIFKFIYLLSYGRL